MDERLALLGKTPISDAAPAGEDAKYDDNYEAMVAELAKLEAVSAENPIDWEVVNDLAIGILENRSKDIVAACYLAHGLYQKQNLSGFNAGLNVISDMLITYYDDLFPPVKRIKARANILSWLAEKTEPLITALDPTVKDFESLQTCLDHINNIQTVCDEKMADKGPAIGGLKRAVRNWRDHLKVEVDKQAKQQAAAAQSAAEPAAENKTAEAPKTNTPTAPKPSTPTAAAIAPAAPVSDMGSPQDVKAAVKSILDVSRKIAQFKREQNIGDPAAYSLLRTSIWLQIERLPPAESGVTQLPEIEPDRQRLLQNLLESGDYANLLTAAESAFCDSMFWLDAHRYAASALEGLGHTNAQQAVALSTQHFVNCFPGITELKFVSGTPFANDMTKLWLDEIASSGDGQGGGGSSGNTWDSAFQQALPLAGKGKFAEGLKIIQDGKQTAKDGREKFMWQLTAAQYLEKSGHVAMAVPQLEHLWKQIVSQDLMEWDVTASVNVAKSLKTCYGHKSFKDKMNPERSARIEELESLIYRLDIDAALMLA
ncbi:type VI secretion system protein TssA [Alteromonadaceae bacterium BrNp21-10]|nr:type VI secretion system protein TssA [Alteromonadaceae bacterium BrNp21-10]